MAAAPKDLFSAVQDGDPSRDWAVLHHDLEAFSPSLLQLWLKEYECWKHNYQRMRDLEQKTLFTGGEEGEVPKPSEQVMRYHRRSLLALMESGEKCAEHLLALPLEGEEAQERLDWDRRIRTLLDGLQESLELWHPINAERIEERKAAFAI